MKLRNRANRLPLAFGSLTLLLLLTLTPLPAQEPAAEGEAAAPPAAEAAPPPEEEGGGEAAASSSPPTPELQTSQPSAANPAGDILNFQADLFTGRFSYSVPVVVPPGRQGSQPGIALSYNSQGANGWCGVGWMLDVGYIQRETRYGVPIKWTGTMPTNQYDDAKGFVFSSGGVGSRLVNIGGNEFRAEVDGAFLKFTYVTNATDNYWRVMDKAGNQSFFGEASTNRMENTKFPAGKPDSTFRWALNRVLDVNGNTTHFNYTTHSNQLYLAKISYNGHTNGISETHTVDFILDTPERTDRSTTFQPGYRVQTRKLLKEIHVKVGASQVRKYVITYTNSPSTTRSLIASVAQFDSSYGNSLPPLTFTYQAQQFGFGPSNNWTGLYSQGQTGQRWNAIRGHNTSQEYSVELLDMDRDGLPDRVMSRVSSPWTNYFALQFNTGTNFYPSTTNYLFAPLDSQGQTGQGWNSVRDIDSDATIVDMADIDGDLLPDRVMRKFQNPFTNFFVQFSTGIPGNSAFTPDESWGPVTNEAASSDWRSIRAGANVYVDLLDMNGDGLPDRVARRDVTCPPCPPYDRFKVQLNTGSGFGTLLDWMTLTSQGETNQSSWSSVYGIDGNVNTKVGLYDINGDGLPDRVMRKLNAPKDNFIVQFNNGAGFETTEDTWGPLENQGQGGDGWVSPVGSSSGDIFNTLADINGDGLIDRIMRKATSPYTNFVVQLNTGYGFAASTNWGPVVTQGQSGSGWGSVVNINSSDTVVDFVDINGDGLPDRIMERATSPYTNFWIVQLNKGPFPDLMNTISNSLGGAVQVSYRPSTQLDNRDIAWSGNPWDSGAVGLLPIPVNVVSNIVVSDGFGNFNTNKYEFSGGFFDYVAREFRGFNMAKVIDPLGTTNLTYFHQSGGRDDSANGEYQDPDSHAKKGIPYRLETWGNDGLLYNRTLNKVEEVVLYSNTTSRLTWTFPFIAQTVSMEYEGVSSYRAIARQFFYNASAGNLASRGNLTNEVNYGEVTNINFSTHAFTDVGSDSLYTDVGYTTLANTNILNKPTSMRIYTGAGQTGKMRETLYEYDARGNRTLQRAWLETPSSYITNKFGYDSYGNLVSSTNQVGIVSTTVFDSTYQTFPVKEITSTFTNQASFDVRSGAATNAIDPKGLVVAGQYDLFFRITNSLISTTAFGTPTLWRSRFSYNLGGMGGGISSNYVHQKVNDAVDATNGHESRSYSDGLGRGAQTRVEAENGQYRVADVVYDQRGNINYTTIPYFSSGLAFGTEGTSKPKTINEYDPIGRLFRVTPPSGEANSPTGPVSTAYRDGNNPWANIGTNAEGKVAKSFHDAYGRTIQVAEINNGTTLTTTYNFDKLGSLTNVIDAAGNLLSTMKYDTLGRKTNMTDSAMGSWSYYYDAAGRLTNQVDSRSQKIVLQYADAIGRLTSKILYNSAGVAVFTNLYAYDTGDGSHTVYPGQLFKVTDREGDERYSYDVRGRVLKTTRVVTKNGGTYATQSTYDDADRVSTLTYPNSVAQLQYTYDTGGNLTNVLALSGTGIRNENFYTAKGFNEAGQATNTVFGNSVTNTYTYYTNTFRLKQMVAASSSTNVQNLTYFYNKLSSLTQITNGITAYSGAASPTVTSIQYDDLDRLTNYVHNGTTYRFGYNAIGNVRTNTEFGTGAYTYHPTKFHAVTNANGKSYSYDLCGSMTNRFGATLTYDEENQLRQYTHGAGTNVVFGYDDGGERLWRTNLVNGAFTLWIGGIYEIKGGKTLCHVFAGGRVCTFQPSNDACVKLQRDYPWFAFCARAFTAALTWPFNEGRCLYTLLLIPLLGVLCVSVVSRWLGLLSARIYWLRFWWKNMSRAKTQRRKAFWSWRLGDLAVGFLHALLRDFRECGSRLRATTGSASSFSVQSSAFDVQRSSCYFPRSPILRFAHSVISVALIVSLFLATTVEVKAAPTYDPVFYYYTGDHLGSSNVLTDRCGNIVQHYEYSGFGKERFKDNTSAFSISNRYTDQTLDEDTGLYYYGARYYDPELARFIQADSIVPDPGDPQSLNRYSYVLNNPFKYTDPSGHEIITAIVVGVLVGAAIGAAAAAIQGGNIWLGLLAGALSGALAGAGVGIGGAVATSMGADAGVGAAIGGAIGGGAGGAAGAAIQGGNIGLGAIIGAASGALFGYLDANVSTTLESSAQGGSATLTMSGSGSPPPAGGGFWSNAGNTFRNVVNKVSQTLSNINAGIQAIRVLPNEVSAGIAAGATAGGSSTYISAASGPAPARYVPSSPTPGYRYDALVFAQTRFIGTPAGEAIAFDNAVMFLTTAAGAGGEARQLTYLYHKVGASGQHLKYGITKSPTTRYTQAELGGGRLRILASGSKEEMLALERNLHSTLPIGPQEGQRFYIDLQVTKGLKAPPY